MDTKDAGKRGGNATKAKYLELYGEKGYKEHYAELGKKGGTSKGLRFREKQAANKPDKQGE